MDLARAVGGDDDDGPGGRRHRAELRHAHLELRQHFEQMGLEGRVRPVDLVDQQHRRAAPVGLQRLQQRALDEEPLAEDVPGQRPAAATLRFGHADGQHLRGVVPLVDGGRRVQPLVTLQAEKAAAQGLGQGHGELRFAAAGFALNQQRPAEREGEEERLRQRRVGDVAPLLQEGARLRFAAGQRPWSVGHGATYPHPAEEETDPRTSKERLPCRGTRSPLA